MHLDDGRRSHQGCSGKGNVLVHLTMSTHQSTNFSFWPGALHLVNNTKRGKQNLELPPHERSGSFGDNDLCIVGRELSCLQNILFFVPSIACSVSMRGAVSMNQQRLWVINRSPVPFFSFFLVWLLTLHSALPSVEQRK